ncbi:Helo N domain containing protein [Pyrenophora tritici-repentis]|uniref:Helo-N domain containing protein n=2 Tax=Pyrenophora tritici-repentis TaxID=45151 RepID=A0A2W1G7Q6_9PLEO|nr:uncharacterized protein PTRG_02472 [Pyrenophora tritici-repentis Pt-1C-BFP]KAG9386825.1 Helo N domain containing protein [Pyrenophora tritici-repentis]EDU44995.1 predicted protein [Pyrenophora tritici-repentis Pt-1C-BFP]KAI0570209.1 Helo-like-N domain-containing protein [Pyrenophora tritici-repentis]KAI0616863.1 Helo-like-N domain-containing protein [Pyrenophora tritici-repentis]KAI1518469.1 Helo-N domain containing protein [Pyrenophora tritici-repentis]
MAEFASAIIGLAAVGIQTSKSLHSLIETYKDAPTEILALSDEVTAFRTMLSQLKEVDELEEWTSQERADARNCLDAMSKNGKHVAQEIEKLIRNAARGMVFK